MSFGSPHSRSARDNHLSIYKVRLWNPLTGGLLHLSATCETRGADFSWLGYRRQAEELKNRALSKGEDWPYLIVDRETLMPEEDKAA